MREEKIREYLLDNEDTLIDVVGELNSYNGCLEHLDFWENDEEFFDTYFNNNPMEAVRATYYGNYNYNDDYVRFNGYGNLESFDEYAKNEEIKDNIDDIVDNLIEYYDFIEIYNEELQELLEEENEEEEEE